MTITVNREYSVHYNKKRIRRLMQILHLKSVCRRKRYNYIQSTPEVTAENILNRDFHADKPNEKWLTDVTEFKYYVGVEVRKIYLMSTEQPSVFRTVAKSRVANPEIVKRRTESFADSVAEWTEQPHAQLYLPASPSPDPFHISAFPG